MKRLFLISLLLFGLCTLSSAQKFSKSGKVGKTGRVVRPVHTVEVPRVPAVKPVPVVSQIGYFHREGNMEFWQPPHERIPLTVPQPRKNPSKKRSRESLLLEATAYGMPDYIAERYTREQLEEWLGTYLSFRNITKGVTSRREQPQDLPVTNLTRREDFALSTMEQRKTAQKWAESQPDYFEENYVTEFEQQYDEDYKKFVIPDGAPYKDKPLRILVVDDDHKVYLRMYDSGAEGEWEDESVSLTYLDTSAKAKRFLENFPQRVDVILLDLAQTDSWMHSRLEVPMYVYNHHLNIPVISFSNESCNNGWLLSYNIVGQYPPVIMGFDMPELIAYLKNIVYTGRARPQ